MSIAEQHHEAETYAFAAKLATRLALRAYRDVTRFAPLPDTLGVLVQIDAILTDRPELVPLAAAEPLLRRIA